MCKKCTFLKDGCEMVLEGVRRRGLNIKKRKKANRGEKGVCFLMRHLKASNGFQS